MNSCIYEGWLQHRRLRPVKNEFRYRVFQMYLDLDELSQVFRGRWVWSASKPALAWFRRADYLGNPAVPLDREVRDLVEERTGVRPGGPIRLLTHLRYWGYIMNPVSFYYCFDQAGEHAEAIVAEITNTPWGERHCYVLPFGSGDQSAHEFRKSFHISPFMPMEQLYRWAFSQPGDALSVRMENLEQGERTFDASLTLARRPINSANLSRVLAKHPLMTAKVCAAIYWQAARLWLKRAPFHEHPSGRDGVGAPNA